MFNPGVESLAQTHENIIITFTEPGDDESRLSAIHAKARRVSSLSVIQLPLTICRSC